MRSLPYSSTSATEHESFREQTPVPTEQSTLNVLVTRANNSVWEVGSLHADGRLQVEVIKGVHVIFVNHNF